MKSVGNVWWGQGSDSRLQMNQIDVLALLIHHEPYLVARRGQGV